MSTIALLRIPLAALAFACFCSSALAANAIAGHLHGGSGETLFGLTVGTGLIMLSIIAGGCAVIWSGRPRVRNAAAVIAGISMFLVVPGALAAEAADSCAPQRSDWPWYIGLAALVLTYMGFSAWCESKRAGRRQREWAEFLRKPSALACIACGVAAFLLLRPDAALAAENIVTPPTVVSVEWGPYIEVLLRWLSEAAIPSAALAIVGLLWKTSTLARMFISEELVERTLRKWADFAINETAEATKGKALSVNVGSAVVANALRRGQERASASKVSEWAWKAGGGPREVGNKIFRMLDIEEGADARVVVEQALRKVGH